MTTYEPNIFEVEVKLKLLVTASNSEHAGERLGVLLHDRITQYIHPDDDPPKYKVVGVCRHHEIIGEPRRRTIIEKHL